MPKRNRVSYAQTQLPFAAASGRLLQDPLKREWRLVTLSGAALLLMVIMYGYVVVNSIAQVSLRESARAEARLLAADRAELEGKYLEKTRGITLSYARSLGYVAPESRVFVTRATALSYASDAR